MAEEAWGRAGVGQGRAGPRGRAGGGAGEEVAGGEHHHDGMTTFFTNRVKLESSFRSQQSLKDVSEKAERIILNNYVFLSKFFH